MREIESITEYVCTCENTVQPINGFYIKGRQYFTANEDINSLDVLFTGFALEFEQVRHLHLTDDTLVIKPIVNGVEGVTVEKFERLAKETLGVILSQIEIKRKVVILDTVFADPLAV